MSCLAPATISNPSPGRCTVVPPSTTGSETNKVSSTEAEDLDLAIKLGAVGAGINYFAGMISDFMALLGSLLAFDVGGSFAKFT